MKPQFNTVASGIEETIGVQVIGISREEVEKMRKIFQLSLTRKRRYCWYEQHSEEAADIVILGPLANAEDPGIHGVAKVTLGENKVPSVSAYHIQTPLIGIRVLRILDQVQMSEQLPQASA